MRLSRSWTSKDDRGRRGHFLLSWPRGIFRHALPRAFSRSSYTFSPSPSLSSSSFIIALLPQDLSDEDPSNRIIVRQSDSRRNSSPVRRYRFVKSHIGNIVIISEECVVSFRSSSGSSYWAVFKVGITFGDVPRECRTVGMFESDVEC